MDWLPTPLTAPADPAPVLALGHCFYFPALGRVDSLVHCATRLSGEALLTPHSLLLRFQALPDELCFELDRAYLAAELAGAAYPLRCQAQPQAPASVWYHHTRPEVAGLAVSALRLSSGSPRLRGSLTLTAYDAPRQLLSGYYEVRANDQPDPTSVASPPEATCTIILAGDFTCLRLQLA